MANAGPPIVDSTYISHWIHLRYQACGFARFLSDSDMKARCLSPAPGVQSLPSCCIVHSAGQNEWQA